MSDVLPLSLVRIKRGICPRCGLPLRLDDEAPSANCEACGCEAVVERRLRTTEPELPGTPLRSEFGDGRDPGASTGPWVRSQQFRQGDVEEVQCPGCGLATLVDATPGAVDILRCDACGTDSRYERRLVARPRTGSSPDGVAPRPRTADELRQLDDAAEDDPETEHLCWRLVHERDPDHRVALALNLLRWRFVNRTAARFVPALITAMHTAPHDARFERALADGFGLLLNQGDLGLRDAVLVAAESRLFRADVSSSLISALGLGSPVGLKLLLDAAEWAERRGDHARAAACLNAVNWLFQRNFEAHRTMGEVLLYRLLYLSGPVLAFALGVAQRRITGTGFHFDPQTLLRFIDDATVERPTLVPELERAFYGGPPEDGAALRDRLRLMASLHTGPARRVALAQYLRPPAAPDDVACAELVVLAESCLGDPELAEAAGASLRGIVEESGEIPAAIHDLVARRGNDLPAELRRHYLSRVPATPHLDPEAIPYWSSPSAPVEADEVARAWESWRTALDVALERDAESREAFREFWSARSHSPEGAAAPVFD